MLFKEREHNYCLRVLTIHVDALIKDSWADDDLDWNQINELYFTEEELEKINNLMR